MARASKPASGASARKIAACMSAMATPPSVLPSTSAARDAGATSTACKKPLWRSSITDIVVKIDVNRTTSMTMPG